MHCPPALNRRPSGAPPSLTLALALTLPLALGAPAQAAPSTQIVSTTFTGAGGDIRYGNGDTTTVTMVTGILPLFDTAADPVPALQLTPAFGAAVGAAALAAAILVVVGWLAARGAGRRVTLQRVRESL